MKFKEIVLMLLVLASLFSITNVVTYVSAYPLITVQVLHDNFEAKPGDTIIIPVKVANLGNESISNVTLYVVGPEEGFKYQTRIIKSIAANQSILQNLIVKVLSPPAGVYSLKVVAVSGSNFAQDVFKVKISAEIDYIAEINVSHRYYYGKDVTAKISIKSCANTPIIGTVKIHLFHDNKLMQSYSSTIYVESGELWSHLIYLPKPEPGNYTIILKTDFYGNVKVINKSFEVYQRILNYKAEFQDGAITVYVKDERENGVPGVIVKINGIQFTTDEYGKVSYAVNKPGTYRIQLNLNGKVVETLVEVKKPFIRVIQKNETLFIHVVDPTGKGISNVTVIATGSAGSAYAYTNASGWAQISLRETGFGTILLNIKNPNYLPIKETVTAEKPPEHLTTTSQPMTNTTIPSVQTSTSSTVPAPIKKSAAGYVSLIVLIAALIFAGTSYVAFFMPIKFEEQLDKYYFVKIKAPKLRGIKNFRYEKQINAVDVRATKGNVHIEGNTVLWEIEELEPEEEAFLQVLL